MGIIYRIFPITWAVVEVEDNPNWLWFVQVLKKDLDLDDGEAITIISNKHQGWSSNLQPGATQGSSQIPPSQSSQGASQEGFGFST
ncbi:hypothetical protein Bca4012_050282 [Brassica carinata]